MSFRRRRFRRCLLCALLLLLTAASPGAEEPDTPNSGNSLLKMDIPIFYGEQQLRERLTELPSGRSKPLGLLLSGGSARAFAHIGVLRALDERGMSPDFIVTDSMGSIVGLLYAAGIPPDEIQRIIHDIELSSLFELELPLKGGLLEVSRFTELIGEALPYEDISELPIPLVVVTEDLKSKRTVLLAKGDVEKVLAASFALPVYFNPVELFGHSLIDGGISNIAPVRFPYRYTNDVIVATTFYRKKLDLNNPITVLNVTMDITKSRAGIRAIKRHDPIWIRCSVETYSFMDWGAIDEIVRRGYRSASELLKNEERIAALTPVAPGYLREAREKAGEHMELTLRRFRRTETVRYSPPVWGALIGLEAEGGPGSTALLHSRNRFSSGAYLKSGFAELSVRGFFQPRWLNRYQMLDGSFGGLSAELLWTPGRLLRLAGNADLNLTRQSSHSARFPSFHSLFTKGELSVPLRLSGGMIIAPFLRGEFAADAAFRPEDFTAVGGISLDLSASAARQPSLTAEAGYFTGLRSSAVQGELTAELPVLPQLALQQRFFARFDSPLSAPVDYFPGDYFRGAFTRELIPGFLIGNSRLSICFPSWKPTFGEMLILDAFSFGPFYDFRLTGGELEQVAGAAADVSLSLIGLKPIELHFGYGWQRPLPMEGGFFSFYLNFSRP